MQRIYLGYMYSRWRKYNILENTGQMQSSFKEFDLKKIKFQKFHTYNYQKNYILQFIKF